MSEFLKAGATQKGRTITKLDADDLAEIVSCELFDTEYGLRAEVKTKTQGTMRFLWDFSARRQTSGRIPVSRLRWLTREGDSRPILTDRDD